MPQIPEKYYEKALANGISRTTLYNRVSRGWDLDQAIATPPDHKKESLRKNSRFYGVQRGKVRTVKMPVEYEEKLNQAIALVWLNGDGFPYPDNC
ncbi:hypothetical protein [Nostoc sp. NIES-3756]|uniref:hypothetical protein n=1 Tax=Nostoc sp. NIES-3756 TaxID=1751286 RepID=UPI000834FCFF|nr:hypothetical protein [Nostoc sp. NIES-3756]